MGDAIDAGEAAFTIAQLHKEKMRLRSRVKDAQDAAAKAHFAASQRDERAAAGV